MRVVIDPRARTGDGAEMRIRRIDKSAAVRRRGMRVAANEVGREAGILQKIGGGIGRQGQIDRVPNIVTEGLFRQQAPAR